MEKRKGITVEIGSGLQNSTLETGANKHTGFSEKEGRQAQVFHERKPADPVPGDIAVFRDRGVLKYEEVDGKFRWVLQQRPVVAPSIQRSSKATSPKSTIMPTESELAMAEDENNDCPVCGGAKGGCPQCRFSGKRKRT